METFNIDSHQLGFSKDLMVLEVKTLNFEYIKAYNLANEPIYIRTENGAYIIQTEFEGDFQITLVLSPLHIAPKMKFSGSGLIGVFDLRDSLRAQSVSFSLENCPIKVWLDEIDNLNIATIKEGNCYKILSETEINNLF